MGFFDRFKRKTIEDALFGELTFYPPKVWEGDTAFLPTGTRLHIFVTANEGGPTETLRNAFNELQQRYVALQPEIADTLFELYGNYRESDESGNLPVLSKPSEIWQTTSLKAIAVQGDGDFELMYSFSWQPKFLINVAVNQWQIEGVALDS